MSNFTPDQALQHELEPTIGALLDRHYANKREWYPEELIPWDEARTFKPGETWDPNQYPLDEGVRSALYVNLLTEDNLPYYFRTLEAGGDRDGAWGEWSRWWTAEEGRHSIVIRDWITATRALDHRWLERGRMEQVSKGETPEPETFADMAAYTSFQELATRVAHANTGRKLGSERGGSKVMAAVAGDENLHHQFLRDVAKAGLEIDPDHMMIAIARQFRSFDMPGTGIPEFEEHKKAIAAAGIYTAKQFLEIVVEPTLAHWGVDTVSGLSANGERARDRIHARTKALTKVVAMLEEAA